MQVKSRMIKNLRTFQRRENDWDFSSMKSAGMQKYMRGTETYGFYADSELR